MVKNIKFFIVVLFVVLAAVILLGYSGFSYAEQMAQTDQTSAQQSAKPVMIDDFETGSVTNVLGARTNVFLKAPSKCMVSFRRDTREGRPTNVLLIRYDKKAEGGPYDAGGWCGYYTLLKKAHPAVALEGAGPMEAAEDVYFDASNHTSITFWVKGEKGNENFVLGVADEHWDKVGDSVKSQEIGKYLPAGKITTEWQKAVVPLEEFFIDYSKLSSIAISFESDCFPEGAGSGKFYIDDLMLE